MVVLRNQLVGAAACVAAAGLLFGVACRHDPVPATVGAAANAVATATKVTLGLQASPAMALVMVAKERGLFEKYGIELELKEFTAGKFALQAFIGGSLDFCVSGEVPVALATMQGSDITVVSAVVRRTVNEVRVVARRDGSEAGGASEFFKSRKRKLATSIGGGPEFFTYKFLLQHGVAAEGVEIVSQAPQDMPAALKAGSVDAVAIFDPFAFLAERLLGEDGVTFSDSALYSEFYVLSASKAQITQSPQNVERLVRALVEAGSLIKADPAKSQEAVAKYTKLEPSVIDGIWKNFEFDAWLPSALITTWDQQAEWAKKTGKVPLSSANPNFSRIVKSEWLKRVRPEAVELGFQ